MTPTSTSLGNQNLLNAAKKDFVKDKPTTRKKKWQQVTTTKPASTYVFNHPKYVVPIPILREYIEANIHKMEQRDMYGNDMDEVGWRDQFCHRVSSIMRCSQESSKRRLYDVMHDKARVINVAFAEAAAIAFGHDLDTDTDIPTLPGNKVLAKDLIENRAEQAEVVLDDITKQQYVNRVLRLCSLISKYPHHHRMLADMAPFNCFRGYK